MSASGPDFELARTAFLQGLQHQQAGEHEAAEHCYLTSLRLLPDRASTLINLAATQLALGRPGDAIAAAARALAVEPDSSDALLHQALGLSRLGRLAEAVAIFDRLLAIDPGHAVAWSFQGEALRELGHFDASANAYRRALDCGAEPTLNRYYLAAVAGEAAPPAPPAAYVQTLFDQYADDFDRHLVDELHYDGHAELVRGLAALAPPGGFESALDIGCGTGLCAPLVRPLARRLTGLDLSARMLDKAAALGLYDRLVQADAVEHLRGNADRHDLLLASDVLIYVGALDRLFEAARAAMRPGIFCFSVEALQAGTADFVLQTSLRYAHRASYVQAMGSRCGFEPVAVRSAPVRQEQGRAVEALYFYLRCPP